MARIIGYDPMNARHRIDAMDFAISFGSKALPQARESALQALLVDELLPLVDEVFNQFSDGDTVWQIDTLDIDIGDVPLNNFSAEMAVRLRTALEHALKEKLRTPAARGLRSGAPGDVMQDPGWRAVSRRQADSELLHAYLAHGNLPWQADASGQDQHEALLQRLLQNGAEEFLDLLRHSPARGNMLLRLVQQFPEAQLYEVLQILACTHVERSRRLMAELRQLLDLSGLDSASQSQAMRLAWVSLLAASLGAPDWAAMAGTIVREVTAQMRLPAAASAQDVLTLLASAARHVQARSGQHGEIAAVLNLPDFPNRAMTDSDTANAVRITGYAAMATASAEGGSSAAHDGEEMPPAEQRVRDRLVQAILSGDAEDIYVYWDRLQSRYPGLLRAAMRRYCAYGDVVERMATGFPESLLRDISALLQPQVALMMDPLWRDAGLFGLTANRHGDAGWGHWKRLQWIASTRILLRSGPGMSAAGMFDRKAFVDAMLPTLAGSRKETQQRVAEAWMALVNAGGVPGFDADALTLQWQGSSLESTSLRSKNALPAVASPDDAETPAPMTVVNPLAVNGPEINALQFKEQAAFIPADVGNVVPVDGRISPSLQLEKIRLGQLSISRELFSSGELEELIAVALKLAAAGDSRPEAARAASHIAFLNAIRARAASAVDRHRYFSQILDALVHGRQIDLEAMENGSRAGVDTDASRLAVCSQAQVQEQAQVPEQAQQREGEPEPAAASANQARQDSQNPQDSAPAPDLQRLRDRLVQALLRGDAAAIYAQWDILMLQHADLLREALSRYCMHDEVLDRIAARFPDSLLLDMAVLLQPQAGQAMHTLWSQPELYDMAHGIALQMDRNEWLRLSWKNGFRHLLLVTRAARANASFQLDAYLDAALPQQPGQDPAVRRQLMAGWRQSLAHAADTGSVHSVENVHADPLDHALVPGISKSEIGPAGTRQQELEADGHVPANIAAILLHYDHIQRSPGLAGNGIEDTQPELPEHALQALHRTQLQAYFQQLRSERWHSLKPHITLAELERLVAAFIALDSRSTAAHRRDFMAAIASRAQLARDRHDYFSELLQTLLEDRVVDLEAIAAAPAAASVPDEKSTSADPMRYSTLHEASAKAKSGIRDDAPVAESYIPADIAAILLRHDDRHEQAEQAERAAEDVRAEFPADMQRANDDAQLQSFFQQLRNADWRQLKSRIALAQLERLTATFIALDSRSDVASRHGFLQEIALQATLAVDRHDFYSQVLQALLEDGAVDLAAIAPGRKGAAVASATSPPDAPPASGEESGAADTSGRPQDDDNANLEHMLGPDFVTEQSLPPGFVVWLTAALQTGPVVLREAFPGLLKDERASSRLLELLPPLHWPRLLKLAPHPQSLLAQRCADDVIDTLAPLYVNIGAERIARLKWQFILRYLFSPGQGFNVANFARELVDYLGHHADAAVTPALAQLLRRRTGLTVPSTMASDGAAALPAVAAVGNSASSTAASKKAAAGAADSAPDIVGELYLINAGMVLATPYLPRLWSMLELTEHGAFKSPQAAERAVHLLQFMVNEKTASPEYQLSLNKLLCGVGSGLPIVREIQICDHEIDVIEQLIKAMIQHWKTIGNTSVKGLRESFLQRPGYLHLKDDAWHLRVQEGVFDMLLDQLPWSFSIIKYPWMERAVHVSWRK